MEVHVRAVHQLHEGAADERNDGLADRRPPELDRPQRRSHVHLQDGGTVRRRGPGSGGSSSGSSRVRRLPDHLLRLE